jgi:hypothetical protein
MDDRDRCIDLHVRRATDIAGCDEVSAELTDMVQLARA